MLSHRPLLYAVCVCVATVYWVPCAEADDCDLKTETSKCISWSNKKISYFISTPFPDTIDVKDAEEQIEQAFEVWSNVNCEGRIEPFVFDHKGGATGTEVGHDLENRVIWINDEDTWKEPDKDGNVKPETALAALTRHCAECSGEILGFDIEINAAHHKVEINDSGIIMAGTTRLRTVLLHELGHLLGLNHSENFGEIMHCLSKDGEAGLTVADIDAFCNLYESAEPVNTCPQPAKGGCAFQQPTTQSPGSLWILLLGLMGLALRRGRLARSTRP